jgi:hypothetical protein
MEQQQRQLVRVDVGIENLVWLVRQDGEGTWSAHCETLRLTAQGNSYRELQEDIEAGIQDLFRHLALQGPEGMAEYFRLAGWHINKAPRVSLPSSVPIEQLDFDVPFQLMDGRRQSKLHAAG